MQLSLGPNGEGQPRPAPKHSCAARGCDRPVPRRMLMCRTHWFQVPAQVRREVWASWLAMRESPTHPAVRRYQAARAAAIDAVTASSNAAATDAR